MIWYRVIRYLLITVLLAVKHKNIGVVGEQYKIISWQTWQQPPTNRQINKIKITNKKHWPVASPGKLKMIGFLTNAAWWCWQKL